MILIVSFLLILGSPFHNFTLGDSNIFSNLPSGLLRFLKRFLILTLILGTGFVLTTTFMSNKNTSRAKLEKMSNEELSQVTGKNLLNFVIKQGQTNVTGTFSPACNWYCSNNSYEYNIDNTDQHFARIELNAKVKIAPPDEGADGVELSGLKIGHYNDSDNIGDATGGFLTGNLDGNKGESYWWGPNFPNFNGLYNQSGSGGGPASDAWDVNAERLILEPGKNDENLGLSKNVVIRGPYIELAYSNFNDGNNSNTVLDGIRFGADAIKGGASIEAINALSGSIVADDFGNWGECSAAGHRITFCESTTGQNALGLFNTAAFGSTANTGRWAGDADGWTEDFWFSFNKEDMFWDYNNPARGSAGNSSETRFHSDGEGFWMHATDDVEGGVS